MGNLDSKDFLRLKGFKRSTRSHAHNMFTRFELLHSTEQAVLRVLSTRGSKSKNYLKQVTNENILEQCKNGFSLSTSALTQIIATSQLSHLLGPEGPPGLTKEHLSSLEILSKPIFVAEFKRDGVEFVSHLFSANRKTFDAETNGAISDLITHFSDRNAMSYLATADDDTPYDSLLKKRFLQLTTEKWQALPGVQESNSDQIVRSELFGLMSALSRHLNVYSGKAYTNKVTTFGLDTRQICSSQMRAVVNDWHDRLLRIGGINRTQSSTDEFEWRHDFDSPVNVLPYVAIEPIDTNFNTIAVIMVEPLDPLFVDERVPDDVRLPTVSVGLYDTRALRQVSHNNLREVQNALRISLASTSYRLTTQSSRDILALAAGEAADISRYWYNEGIAKLFGHDANMSGLEKEDTVTFWERFVEDLLCADIPGLRDVEVYPFDRAIILQEVGSRDVMDDKERGVEISILETGLTSISPKDQGTVLSSPQRVGRDLGTEFDLTRKRVLFKGRYKIQPTDFDDMFSISPSVQIGKKSVAGTLQTLRLAEDETENVANLSLQSIISSLRGNKRNEESQAAQNKLRQKVSDEGILFSYESGIRLKDNSPQLEKLITEHFIFMNQHAADLPGLFNHSDLNNFVASINNNDSKIVTFVFDPEMSSSNKIPGGGYFLSPTNAVTLILVADEDVEKSVQDTNAEREDFKVVLNMIVRQRVQDKQKEHGIVTNRLQTATAMLSGLFHKIAASGLSPGEKAEIQSQWDGIKQIISDDSEALNVNVSSSEALIFLLSQSGLEDKQLQSALMEWDGDKFALEVRTVLERRLSSLLANFSRTIKTKLRTDIKLDIAKTSMPETSLQFPRAAICECFDVLFKNAIEATVVLPQDIPAIVSISVEVRPGQNGTSVLDIRLDNNFSKMDEDTWFLLVSPEPQHMGENKDKQKKTGHSTGIGVFAARQLLQKGFGKGADIYFEGLGAKSIRARMSIPCQVLPPQLTDNTVATPVTIEQPQLGENFSPLILYVEDEESLRINGQKQLAAAFGEERIIVSDNQADALMYMERYSPPILLTDMSILKQAGGRSHVFFGAGLIAAFFRTGRGEGDNRKRCFVLSGGSSNDIRKQIKQELAETPPDEVQIKFASFKHPWKIDDKENDVLILEALKQPADSESLLPFISTLIEGQLANRQSTELVKPDDDFDSTEVTPDLTLASSDSAKWIDHGKTLSDRIDAVQQETATGTLYVKIPGRTASAGIAQWLAHPGMIDPSISGKRVWPLWNADYSQHVVGVIAMPEKWDSMAARYWLTRNKILLSCVASGFDQDHWANFRSESGGFLARLRHDVRNVRLETTRRTIFDEIEKLSKEIETALAFDNNNTLWDLNVQKQKSFQTRIEEELAEAKRLETPALVETITRQIGFLAQHVRDLAEQAQDQSNRPSEAIFQSATMTSFLRELLMLGRKG
ncbi:MAG: hypothetical protein ABJN24_01055 [Hyphomicrobiales bacterium]